MQLMQVQDLSKCYRNGDGIEHLSFSIQRGEIVALLGPNGAGKTTTIRCLTGLYKPDKGNILIDGSPPGHVNVQKKVALIPDQPHLYPTLTAAEHIQFRARGFHQDKKDLKERVYDALKEVHLEEKADELCGQLSRGQKQRVVLAGAIVQDALLYILDEPTVGLDIPSKQWLSNWLKAKTDQGCAAFVSTHSLEFVLETADRVLLIRDGELMKSLSVPQFKEEQSEWRKEVIRLLGEWSDE
ncbi:ABC transporter ATP-binding protein [Bacillus tequilensis]|uniref:ABC transporter ATP-binding protein n=1 Tax=Bacillus tequilensis TaxID=227866 RepID=A0A6H0WGP9_9BACI|nr:ABC transporter ATP-binding protein [Bacillus tequilensis]QIW78556.1 ABC transporter ATP-binding protein [Bacillus tequilensis]